MTRAFATVTPIGIEASRRAHPSSLTPRTPPASLEHSLAASLVQRWLAGAEITEADAAAVVGLLLGAS